jgi:hypothetical protein
MNERSVVRAASVASFVAILGSGAWAQQREVERIHAENPGRREYFGHSLAIRGGWMIAGIDYRLPAGAAELFRFDAKEKRWAFFQELTPSAATADFGNCVAIDGKRAVVGSSWVSKHGTELPSAYVYEFDGSSWVETQRLTSSSKKQNDYFGDAVGIDGDDIVVGAPYDNSGAGAAYVFSFNGSSWTEVQRLRSFGPHFDVRFGYALAIHRDVIAVGAPDDKGRTSCGHVYVFTKNRVGRFVHAQELEPGDPESGESFGNSVAIGGESIAVGAHWRSTGAVYVFHRDEPASWSQTQRLVPILGGWFGNMVRIDGDALAVGAPYANASTALQGMAYLYRLHGREWRPARAFQSSGPTSLYFGGSLAMDRGTLLVDEELGSAEGVGESGLAHRFDVTGLSLFVTPSEVAAGAKVVCTTSGGVPGTLGALALTNVGGLPTFVPLASGTFSPVLGAGDAAMPGGEWIASFDVGPMIPPGLSGQRLELTSYGFAEDGGFSASEPAAIRVR